MRRALIIATLRPAVAVRDGDEEDKQNHEGDNISLVPEDETPVTETFDAIGDTYGSERDALLPPSQQDMFEGPLMETSMMTNVDGKSSLLNDLFGYLKSVDEDGGCGTGCEGRQPGMLEKIANAPKNQVLKWIQKLATNKADEFKHNVKPYLERVLRDMAKQKNLKPQISMVIQMIAQEGSDSGSFKDRANATIDSFATPTQGDGTYVNVELSPSFTLKSSFEFIKPISGGVYKEKEGLDYHAAVDKMIKIREVLRTIKEEEYGKKNPQDISYEKSLAKSLTGSLKEVLDSSREMPKTVMMSGLLRYFHEISGYPQQFLETIAPHTPDILKAIVAEASKTQADPCADTVLPDGSEWTDEKGYNCAMWASNGCEGGPDGPLSKSYPSVDYGEGDGTYSAEGQQNIEWNCRRTCKLCPDSYPELQLGAAVEVVGGGEFVGKKGRIVSVTMVGGDPSPYKVRLMEPIQSDWFSGNSLKAAPVSPVDQEGKFWVGLERMNDAAGQLQILYANAEGGEKIDENKATSLVDAIIYHGFRTVLDSLEDKPFEDLTQRFITDVIQYLVDDKNVIKVTSKTFEDGSLLEEREVSDDIFAPAQMQMNDCKGACLTERTLASMMDMSDPVEDAKEMFQAGTNEKKKEIEKVLSGLTERRDEASAKDDSAIAAYVDDVNVVQKMLDNFDIRQEANSKLSERKKELQEYMKANGDQYSNRVKAIKDADVVKAQKELDQIDKDVIGRASSRGGGSSAGGGTYYSGGVTDYSGGGYYGGNCNGCENFNGIC